MNILDHVEQSLADFRPHNPREYVALQLARRFNDLPNLAKYLTAATRHTKRALLLAAQTARMRHELNRTPISALFFEILAEQDAEAPPR
jgi:hypothetical protein